MTVAEKLSNINEIKEQIRDAVTQKGGNLSAAASFSEYPGAVLGIPQNIIEGPPGAGLDIYSEEERVVGVWFDGRPVYKRSYFFETIDIDAGKVQLITFSDISIAAVPTLVCTINGTPTPIISSDGVYRCWATRSGIQITVTSLEGVTESAFNKTQYNVFVSFTYVKSTDEVPEL